MTVVVDLGSETYGLEESLHTLIGRFSPDRMYAFDPLGPDDTFNLHGRHLVTRSASAAWIRDGQLELGVGARGMDTTAMAEKSTAGEWAETRMVPCFDFSYWLTTLDEPAIVKMDIEGAEYPILEKMVADQTDTLVKLLLVEWHDDKLPGGPARRHALKAQLKCEVHGWP